ncbi:uncharacterized protein LAESUDRAFT_764736 [Laetiporus sulphureus 93-53]|uniref:Retrotransposon gag domain-containing protein n=1 Tax=Laetiporus sulphureus 93-53 TaxID=1314785 RepID=A0A165B5Y6_9APHY|nr:uncharacterized protein LAESUDRAFT_764736 [Laetiporus sulphureus 93-53]KZT00314.1 hypothetical protein LAESUDRAFT_764736 [Laetiporus sulphureus 93-53]
MNLQIWLDYNNFTDDKDKIRQVNVHLEGGAALYMKEYAIKLSSRQPVGTWTEYTRKLEMAYKMLDPKRTAQAQLDAHGAIHHKTMIAFAENFRAYAPESGYSDQDLIVKIREQRSSHIQTVMSVTETLDPGKISTDWMGYLEFCLEIEIKHLQQLSGSKPTGQTTGSKATAPKDPNAMDTSTRIAHELSSEQDRWLPEYKGKQFQTRTAPKQEKGKALEQAIAALRGMSTTSTTPPSSKGKGKVKGTDMASMASASTVKDTNVRIIEMDEFSEDFQYEV